MRDAERKAWEDDVAFAKWERKENPEITINVLAGTILAADAIVQRAGEESIATFIRKEMLYDHPGDADMVAKKLSAYLKGEGG